MPTVGVIGLGYVGLPLAVAFCEAGYRVVGVDVNARRVAALATGRSAVEDVPDARLAAVADRFDATTRYATLAQAEAVFIAVPTPLTANREPDLGPLAAAGTALADVLQRDQLVVLESTTYPGTTRERLVPLLEESGLAAGRDFAVAYSPERIDPGRTDHTVRNTPRVVAGLTPACRARACALYSAVCDELVEVSTPEVAELTKLLENVFRSVNIALVNELAILCDRMGIDVWEVIDAAATKPFGFMPFRPGAGLGGECLTADPFYLAWRAREFDLPTEFVGLAAEVNQAMPYFCAQKVADTLNEHSLPVRGTRIAVVGVSYKEGVADVRQSPALKVMELLRAKGAELSYHDEYVATLPELGLSSRDLGDALAGCDCAVVVTAHPGLDAERLAHEAPLVVDFRGIVRGRRAAGDSAAVG